MIEPKRKIDVLEFGNDLGKFLNGIVQPVSIGNKVIVLAKDDVSANKKYLTYDVLTGQWKLEENDFIGIDYIFSCSKVPFV